MFKRVKDRFSILRDPLGECVEREIMSGCLVLDIIPEFMAMITNTLDFVRVNLYVERKDMHKFPSFPRRWLKQ